MNKQQIEKWAREAGLDESLTANLGEVLLWEAEPVHLERFAALVAAHEREQCALVCDAMGNPWRGSEDCSAAIRKRDNQQSK